MAAFARYASALVVAAGCLLLSGGAASGAEVTPKAYRAVGTTISGGSSAADGPLLRPGQYLDSLPRGSASPASDGSSDYYTVNLSRGETPYVSATLIPPQERSESTTLEIEVEISDLEQSSGCSFQSYNSVYSTSSDDRLGEISAAVHSPTLGGKDWPEDCPARGTFSVRVTRTGNAFATLPMPTEVGLHIEPRAVVDGLPGAATPQDYVQSRVAAETQPIVGGRTFDDAPVVASGRYRDTIVPGENHYLRVHLNWGQRLSYLLSTGRVGDRGSEETGDADVHLYSPVRSGLEQAEGGKASAYSFGGDDNTMYGSSQVPVRYQNRFSDDDEIAKYAIDGDYYIVVSTDFVPTASSPFRIPYTIAIEVVGTAEAGPTYLIGSTGSSASPSAGQASSNSGGIVLPAAIAIAAVLVVGSAATALVLRRRRPARAGGQPDTRVMSGAPQAQPPRQTQAYGAPYPPAQHPPPQHPPPRRPSGP